jgi:hypothetical protein
MRPYAALLLALLVTFSAAFPRSSRNSSVRSTTGTAKKSEHVGSYTRKNGTVVRSYNRSPAGTATHSTTPKTGLPAAATGRSRVRAKAAAASPASPKAITRKSTAVCAPCSRDTRGRIARSETAKHAFERSHPCPATGKASGACPGYVVDHVVPLKRGGADAPGNMQWQTTAAAKAKDRIE